MCETIDAGKRREEATMKKDENIFIHIRDKDCVAIEVCYHNTCYKNITRILFESVTGDTIDSSHNTAYKAFCDERTKNYFMKKLEDIFREYILKYEGDQDGSGYSASKLKKRLEKSHPQLVFHAPTRRNASEIVFAEDP